MTVVTDQYIIGAGPRSATPTPEKKKRLLNGCSAPVRAAIPTCRFSVCPSLKAFVPIREFAN